MIDVLFILGTRPEAVKLAPVIRNLSRDHRFQVRVCSTGQHLEMLEQVLDFFQLNIDFRLKVMRPGQSLSELTSRIIDQLSSTVLNNYKPAWIIVQGDTTTALAGALVGFYHKIKVAHVEAGLRSNHRYSPFPEEMNRVLISRLADCHFCPTGQAVKNLRREGITEKVYQVGNSGIDAALDGITLMRGLPAPIYAQRFDSLNLQKKIILITCHRRESFGTPFLNICKALRAIVDAHPECVMVYPVHLNPQIKDLAVEHLKHQSILLMDPLPYDQFLWMLDKCYLVLTDSGGLQEEAPSLKKPVLVLREVTERTEGVMAGTSLLVGTNAERIFEETHNLLVDQDRYAAMMAKANPYGDGKTAQRVADILASQ